MNFYCKVFTFYFHKQKLWWFELPGLSTPIIASESSMQSCNEEMQMLVNGKAWKISKYYVD